MKFKRTIIVFFLFSAAIISRGQLQPLMDQYMLNGLAINPAYAGSHEALSVALHSRNQWVGFEGAPRTITFTSHSPLRNKKVNLGLIVMNDRIGTRNETGVIFSYAYRIELGKGDLSFGLAGGLSNLYSSNDLVRFTDPGDPLITNPYINQVLPDFSFGTYYYSSRFYAGISAPMFMSHSFNHSTGNLKIGFHPERISYILTSGYLFNLSNEFELLPSLLLKSNPSNSTQLDINCSIIYKNRVWLGTSMRTSKSMGFQLQYQANDQLRIAYSYGMERSELRTVQKGSHEVVLQYNFSYLLEVISPRYF